MASVSAFVRPHQQSSSSFKAREGKKERHSIFGRKFEKKHRGLRGSFARKQTWHLLHEVLRRHMRRLQAVFDASREQSEARECVFEERVLRSSHTKGHEILDEIY